MADLLLRDPCTRITASDFLLLNLLYSLNPFICFLFQIDHFSYAGVGKDEGDCETEAAASCVHGQVGQCNRDGSAKGVGKGDTLYLSI